MIKKAMEVLYYFFIILFLLIMVLIIIYNNLRTNDDSPQFLKYELFIVTSGSMEKTISPGDLIITSPAHKLFVGDIIVYTKNSVNTTHRIVAIISQDSQIQYVTKGDSNPTPDYVTVAANEVIGKVILTIPYLGILIKFLKTPTGLLVLLVIPTFVLFIDFFQKVITDILKPKIKNRRGDIEENN